jgi:hypothetical protein
MKLKMNVPSKLLAISFLLVLSACGPETSDTRIGTPRAPREAQCDLKVINGNDTSNFAKFEQVGVVQLANAPAGTAPFDPKVRDMVRPRACALGGEAISVLGSGDVSANGFTDSAYATYIVWAKKHQVSSAPEKF